MHGLSRGLKLFSVDVALTGCARYPNSDEFTAGMGRLDPAWKPRKIDRDATLIDQVCGPKDNAGMMPKGL